MSRETGKSKRAEERKKAAKRKVAQKKASRKAAARKASKQKRKKRLSKAEKKALLMKRGKGRKKKKGKRKGRRRTRRKRKNRREGREEKKVRWCRVRSERTNTKVVRSWNPENRSRKGGEAKRSDVGKNKTQQVKELSREKKRPKAKQKVVERKGSEKPAGQGKKNGKGVRRKEKVAKEETRTKVTRKTMVKTAGSRGYKGIRHRGTDYAAKKLRGRVLEKGKSRQGLEGIHIRREGKGKGGKARKQRLVKTGRNVRSRSDTTREAHNGCKGKKARRR